MDFTSAAWQTFNKSIEDYHITDNVDQEFLNPFPPETIENLLYRKNWIDTVQWHLEDIIRDPRIEPAEALKIKRRIDQSNQDRTDIVEQIDAWFLNKYKDINKLYDAEMNTETPAWALDRFSILALKIYHMQQEVARTDVETDHIKKCQEKLAILKDQKRDLQNAISNLLDDLLAGRKYMKLYRQMKMYNDESLNPILYKNK